MANMDLTEIVVLLDRSGSMEDIREDMIGGFARFVEEQKACPGACRMSLYRFDNEYETAFEAQPLASVPPLELVPRGSTALVDAMGKTIATVGDRFRNEPETQRPGRVIFMVITDGHENASREWKLAQVAEQVKHQNEKYQWQFMFLGAGIDAWDAGRLGMKSAGAKGYVKSPRDMAALYRESSRAVRNYCVSAVGQDAGGSDFVCAELNLATAAAEVKAEDEESGS